jgi:hypothetical protein
VIGPRTSVATTIARRVRRGPGFPQTPAPEGPTMRRSSSRGKRCNGRNRLLVQRRQRPILGAPSFPARRRNLGFATAPVGRAQRRYPGRVLKWNSRRHLEQSGAARSLPVPHRRRPALDFAGLNWMRAGSPRFAPECPAVTARSRSRNSACRSAWRERATAAAGFV